MTLENQIKLKEHPYIIAYLRDNSYWYKYLNRNPKLISEIEEKAKEYYGLRPTDKISRALDTIELVQNILTTLK